MVGNPAYFQEFDKFDDWRARVEELGLSAHIPTINSAKYARAFRPIQEGCIGGLGGVADPTTRVARDETLAFPFAARFCAGALRLDVSACDGRKLTRGKLS